MTVNHQPHLATDGMSPCASRHRVQELQLSGQGQDLLGRCRWFEVFELRVHGDDAPPADAPMPGSELSARWQDRVFTDKASDRDTTRPVLMKFLRFVGREDRDVRLFLELGDASLREYTAQQLAAILDPAAFVVSRTSAGGTASTRRRELAAEAAADIEAHQHAVASLSDGITQARERLIRDAKTLVGG